MGKRDQQRRWLFCMRLLTVVHFVADHILSGEAWRGFAEYEEDLAKLRQARS